MEPQAVRARVRELIAQRRDSMADLSRMLGRNAAWMQQYLGYSDLSVENAQP